MSLTVGSLFAGIGGIELGLERAGMDVVWQVEKDDYCRKVLAKRWPDITRIADIRRDFHLYDLEEVDVLAGGFPCQEISHAGPRSGLSGGTSLWDEFAGAIGRFRPRYVLVENSPSLVVRGLGTVLRDLAELGYDAEWDCLPAAAVGAPHLRARTWVLAYACSGRHGLPETAILTGGARPELRSWWSSEPDVGRVADGVPDRVDRIRALGNAVVPQVAEWIGRRIVEHADASGAGAELRAPDDPAGGDSWARERGLSD